MGGTHILKKQLRIMIFLNNCSSISFHFKFKIKEKKLFINFFKVQYEKENKNCSSTAFHFELKIFLKIVLQFLFIQDLKKLLPCALLKKS